MMDNDNFLVAIYYDDPPSTKTVKLIDLDKLDLSKAKYSNINTEKDIIDVIS